MWKRVCLEVHRMVATDSDAIDVMVGAGSLAGWMMKKAVVG